MGGSPTMPAVQTVTHVILELKGSSATIGGTSGMDQLLFSSCSAPDWSIDAPKHIFHGNSGAPVPIIAAVQNPTYSPMTLTQGWDPNNTLAAWMNTISDPTKAITDKKMTVTAQFCDNMGTVLFQWVGTGGLLTGFSHSPSDASSNGVLTITATIEADTWQLCDANGSPLAGGSN
jgi:hypothetical protein